MKKTCSRCKAEKPATTQFFMPDNRRKSGVQNPCRSCLPAAIENRFRSKALLLTVRSSQTTQEELNFGKAKTCNRCGKQKPVEMFYISKTAKDGRRPKCIECWRMVHYRTPEQNRAFRLKHHERIKEYDRARIKPTLNKLKKAKYDRNYRAFKADEHRSLLLVRNFGINLDEYNRMLAEQGGVCALCKQPETAQSRSGKVKNLAVDHCHKTGKVRKLLCGSCNGALGLFKDDISAMGNAIEYLREHRGS